MTSDRILAAYDQVLSRIDRVNQEFIVGIANHVKEIGQMLPSDVDKINQMQLYGADKRDIKRKLDTALAETTQDIRELMAEAVNLEYESKQYLGATQPTPQLERYINSMYQQTAGRFLNYSQTTNIDTAYQEVISDAIDAVSRGLTDYNSAIRASMRKLGGDGLMVRYASGTQRRMDTAIRQNILDGVRQVSALAAKQIGQEIGADGVELSAHPNSAPDHEPAQGRMYTLAEFEKMQSGHPFKDVDGNEYGGFPRPITQWNCRHFPSYVILGVSKRRYTDQQLNEWARTNARGVEIDGKPYTMYQVTQIMRGLEAEIRRNKDIYTVAKTYGDDVLSRDAQANITRFRAEYQRVSEISGLSPKTDRLIVESFSEVA